jgi:hypothetical protein
MQHRALGVHWVGVNLDRPSTELRIRTIPYLEIVKLDGMKSKVLAELRNLGDDRVDLRPLVREYVEGLAVIHKTLRSLLDELVREARSRLDDFVIRAQARWPGKIWFVVSSFGEEDAFLESFNVFPDIGEYWSWLVNKNRLYMETGRHFVSGQVD